MELLKSLDKWVVFGIVYFVAIVANLLTSRGKEPSAKSSIYQTLAYIGLGLAFGYYVYLIMGHDAGVKWVTGFTLEYALSVDNLFVIGVIMTSFGIVAKDQPKLLFWGIFGAIVLRGIFIAVGTEIIGLVWWLLPALGVVVILLGAKVLFMHGDDDAEPKAVGWMKALGVPVFFGALGAIELTDIIFALDSVPAMLAISTDKYIAFTAPMFSVLGLRCLYFCVQALKDAFHHLPKAIGLVLVFIGIKIVLPALPEIFHGAPHIHVETLTSLLITLGLLACGIIASLVFPEKKEQAIAQEA